MMAMVKSTVRMRLAGARADVQAQATAAVNVRARQTAIARAVAEVRAAVSRVHRAPVIPARSGARPRRSLAGLACAAC